jgi:hypothetical protein
MNPMLMQMWIVAFTSYIDADGSNDGTLAGYHAAKYADDVIKGAQKAAEEMKEAASKVVSLS